MARGKKAILSVLLIFSVVSCASPLTEKGKADAAGDSEISKPSAAPEYFEMVQALAEPDQWQLGEDSYGLRGKVDQVAGQSNSTPAHAFSRADAC